MTVLSVLGVLFILVVACFVVCAIANVVCQPVMANSAVGRFENRAKREMEQGLYKLLCGLVLAGIVVVLYAVMG